MRHVLWLILVFGFLVILGDNTMLTSQTLTTNIAAKKDDETSTQIAIPGGAGATVSGSGTAGAGPLLGFQVWHQDQFLLSSFFSFSAPQAISGQQHDFGAFLLNPPGQGTSYSFAGNHVNCFPKNIRQCNDTERKDSPMFLGFAGRIGITNTSWQTGSGGTAQSVSGTVAYLTPAILVTSKTYVSSDDNENNQYQFGISAGPTFRFLAGDLAQKSNDSFRLQTLGTNRRSYTGAEVEFFVRLNQFQPFVRVSHFSAPGGTDISGFSGTQVVFGVNVLSAIFQKTLK